MTQTTLKPVVLGGIALAPTQPVQDDVLLTFKEAMGYLRVSRSTLYRLMWSGQLSHHKVGSTWRFWREDVRACVRSGASA